MKLRLPAWVWPMLWLWASGVAHGAGMHVSHLEVRIVTGADELSAGSVLELRIYEAGKSVKHLSLVHGEAWARNSTHMIPVELNEPIDPRNVVRFSLYYRNANPAFAEFQIVAADVELPSTTEVPGLLLGATLSGIIIQQGELATTDLDQAALVCNSDADCDDKKMCNGKEHCEPYAAGADVRGCVKGLPVVCPVNQVCGEGVGCRGVPAAAAKP